MYHTFTLDSGLRVIVDQEASPAVVYAGIAVAAGTRYEAPDEAGMAHFVEHMTFKGTPDLSSLQILNRMESVGGDLNAYTGKEEVIYYATFPREHLRRALVLLADIVFHSTFPQAELEKEREVVIDEIESYNDSPADLIYDDFEGMLFGQQPLGRRILGNAESLRRFTSLQLQAFTRRLYSPSRVALFIKGRVDVDSVHRLLSTLSFCTNSLAPQSTPWLAANTVAPANTILRSAMAGQESVVRKDCHQAHVMLGAPAYSYTDPRRIGLALLSNLLGGPAMNSRLSLALRERTGLVYTVESAISTYSDTATWGIYFGCDHTDVRRCLRLVHRELRHLIDAPLTSRALTAAKRQLCGQISIATDNFESSALSMAKRYLLTGHARTLEEQYQLINDLQATDLQAIAQQIFAPENLTTLIYE